MENSKMGVAERLRYLIDLKNMTIQGFSDFLDFPKGTLEKYLNSGRVPSAELLSALYSKMGVSAHWLLDGIDPMFLVDVGRLEALGVTPVKFGPITGPKSLPEQSVDGDFAKIPRYQVDASAGHGVTVEDEAVSGHYAFNRKWLTRRNLNPKNLAVISVRGDSMEPRLRDGDLIVLDRSQTEIADGRAFVLRLGTDLVVKYIQRLGASRISLLSANTFYPPREIDLDKIDGEAEIIGRVVASMQEW